MSAAKLHKVDMQSLMALPRPPLHRLQKAIETRMRGRGDGPLTKILHVGWLGRKQKLPCKIHQQTVRLPIGEGNKKTWHGAEAACTADRRLKAWVGLAFRLPRGEKAQSCMPKTIREQAWRCRLPQKKTRASVGSSRWLPPSND